MHQRERPSVDVQLVDRVAADLGHHVVDDLASTLLDDLLDHVLEEAEDRVRGDVHRLDVLGRLDHRRGLWIELQDGRVLPAVHASRSLREASSAPVMTSPMPTTESTWITSSRKTTPRINATTGVK